MTYSNQHADLNPPPSTSNSAGNDTRILRKVGTLASLVQPRTDDLPTRRVAVIDTEATSTNPQTAEVFDIAAAVLEVDVEGKPSLESSVR